MRERPEGNPTGVPIPVTFPDVNLQTVILLNSSPIHVPNANCVIVSSSLIVKFNT
ncbi:hypothetical protein D3C87_1376810 [compost metagenome]